MTAGRQQVWPVNYEAEASQRLVDAAHRGDLREAVECLSDPLVDVNFAGAVSLKGRRTEVALADETAGEVIVECEEFRTDVSPLFLAAHAGDLSLLRTLLNGGADVNQRLFRGYATSAAAREGRLDILEVLLKAGASQPACEEALLEASSHGRASLAELLMASDLIRPQIAVHALVSACFCGFLDVVDALVKCGVDANATDRVLLRSLKPSLHANADCTALIAAIVGRQVPVVRRLLQAGARKDSKVRLGAWSWDTATGEEFRVGAGLAEPYDAAWCAVEYFESTGTILRAILDHYSFNALHLGRNLLHHAVLCANPRAVAALLAAGADRESPVVTSRKTEFRPIHLATRLGHLEVLHRLIDAGSDLDSRTDSGETALMLSSQHKHEDCLRALASAGADLGLVSSAGASAALLAASNHWSAGFQRAVLSVIKSGGILKSSDSTVFSPVIFVARCGDVRALEALLALPGFDVDEQDESGFSSLMIAAKDGDVDLFRFLVFAGANVNLESKSGETVITISESSAKSELFEEVMLEFALDKGNAGGFYALHCAARKGDLPAIRRLIFRGYDVNLLDGDDYTALMLAAREGHGELCKLLISSGARCEMVNCRGETALSLARKNSSLAEGVVLDEIARRVVLAGGRVKKHTKKGRGSPHGKTLRMVESFGVLRWGKSRRRNVVCEETELGGSSGFVRNRRRKGDGFEGGLFRVVTTKGKEFHFVCEGGEAAAELWVRGIRLLTREGSDRGKKI